MITDTEIKKLKPTGKEYQKADTRGLVLVVRAKGSKFWRYEFRLDGKKFKYGYGSYPEIGLSDARKIHAVGKTTCYVWKAPCYPTLAASDIIDYNIHYTRHGWHLFPCSVQNPKTGNTAIMG